MKQLLIAAFLLVCVTAPAFAATDHGLEQQLEQEYVGKVLILRHPVTRGSQRYDASGKRLSGGHEGTWTVDGAMRITGIDLTAKWLRLKGRRVLLVYDPGKGAMDAYPEKGPSLKVEVVLDRPCASQDEATSMLHRVFAITDEELLSSVPVYWKSFVAKRAGLKREETDPGDVLILRNWKQASDAMPGVIPPKPIYAPMPESGEFARTHRIHGTVELAAVIDAHGKVQQPRIVRPVGMGLDEQAIETAKSWQFRPATKDGHPVAAEVILEMQFNFN